MAKKPRAADLRNSISGQHVSLAVAAHLARTQLLAGARKLPAGQELADLLDLVAQALAGCALLHVTDAHSGETRELDRAELEGAVAKGGATLLVLKDGRTLTGVSMRRADLRQAIALLQAAGVPELAASTPPAAAGKPVLNGDGEALRVRLAEIEELLRPPLLPEQVERAKAGAVWIARHSSQGRIANLAMQLMSALHESRKAEEETPGGFRMALARLRAAIEQPRV